MGGEAGYGHASRPKAVHQVARRHPSQCGYNRPCGQDEPDTRCVLTQCAGEIEGPHHECRHHHGRDQAAHRETAAQHRIAKHRQLNQGRCCSCLAPGEESHAPGCNQSRTALSTPK